VREVTVAAAQFACTADLAANVRAAERLVREAAAQGAQVVCLQELFETPYFCTSEDARTFDLARPLEGHPTVARFQDLCRELGVVVPVNFFERAGRVFFNTAAIVDADGSVLGIYRKSHIPDDPGYLEKYYFSPGNTGFRVWDTRYARIGVGICWDQWFPECARAMALQGAELLLYPTCIGDEPVEYFEADISEHWQLTMRGHAGANLMPVVAANRIGSEPGPFGPQTYWGQSFICDHRGALRAVAPRDEEAIVTATFDLDEIEFRRREMTLFRDRRVDLYGPLLTLDGDA
jgi:N-carbamoylputrescine amidase